MRIVKMRIGLLGFVLVAAIMAQSATVSNVKARQRYPWNGMVDIDYTITSDTTDMALAVSAKDNDTGRVYTPTNFLEALPVNEGTHRITWSTEADGLQLVSSNCQVTVSLVKYDAAAITNDLFYVIDLSGGPSADHWPVTLLASVPKEGWNDEYKTKKLVLRRIEPGTCVVTVSSVYYIVSAH